MNNLSEIRPYEEDAIDTVVSVLNKAQEKLGIRQTLRQFANSRGLFSHAKLTLTNLVPPLALTSEAFIAEVIEKKWKLTETFMYFIKYQEGSQDESTQYFYFEVIFSQPTVRYPIPHATVSVFFRVSEKYYERPAERGVPQMIFRIEGHNTSHDIRYVKLTTDWILAVLQMKLKLFKRIEMMNVF